MGRTPFSDLEHDPRLLNNESVSTEIRGPGSIQNNRPMDTTVIIIIIVNPKGLCTDS